MKRVFLYIRVSTEEQAIHGLSIEAQTAALESWARANGHEIAGTYVDAGISARKPASKRPALQRLIVDIRAGAGDLVVFTKLDRWFRNIAEYYKVQEILEKCHVDWRTIQEDYDTSTASGRLKINIMLSVAQDEADRTGERIKFIFEDKVRRGEVVSGKVPLGYRIEGKRLQIDEASAPVARDIFNQYLALRSLRSLREYIMERHGLMYCYTGVKALLQNERYIGRAHGQDDFCPPLIEPGVFAQVQRLLEERAQRNSGLRSERVYLFTGLVYCAECGNRLSAHTVRGTYIYYRCTRYEKLHLCTHRKRTSERVLEDWLIHNLLTEFAQYNLELEAKGAQPRPQVDAGKLRRKMEKLKDLYLNDLIDREVYERDYTALRDELRSAAAEEEALPQPVDLEELRTGLSLYEELSRQNKKEFWSRVIRKIVVTNEDGFFVVPCCP